MITRRRLGRTGLKVSEVSVGCWAIGGPCVNLGFAAGWDNVSTRAALAGLRYANSTGVNLFDTANVYGLGQSELRLGAFLKGVPRESVIVSDKFGYLLGEGKHGFAPSQIEAQLRSSLQKLATPYIDIYGFHHLDFGPGDKYLKAAISQVRGYLDDGRIRYISMRGPHEYLPKKLTGQSSPAAKQYKRFLRLANKIDPDVISIRYNVLSPTFDGRQFDIFKWAEERDVGILINKPLAQGLLLDKYDPQNPPQFGKGDHRNRKLWFSSKGLTLLHERLTDVKRHFGASRRALSHTALAYCLARSDSASVLVGFRNSAQLKETLSVPGPMSADERGIYSGAFQGLNEDLGPFTRVSSQ